MALTTWALMSVGLGALYAAYVSAIFITCCVHESFAVRCRPFDIGQVGEEARKLMEKQFISSMCENKQYVDQHMEKKIWK